MSSKDSVHLFFYSITWYSVIRRKFRWAELTLYPSASLFLVQQLRLKTSFETSFIGIRRTFCRALHCCIRSTCTRFCALGSAMGFSPVPVHVGSSTRSSMRPPSRGPPLRAICVWCIELARSLCRSWPSRRTQCSPLMPNSWWPSVRWILCVVSWWGGYLCQGGLCQNFKHLSRLFCTAAFDSGLVWGCVYFRYLLCPFYK